MRKSEEETRPLLHERWRRAAEGWTGYEPLEPEPSAAGAEVTVIDATPRDEPAAEGIDEYAKRHDSVRQEHSAYFEDRAKDLLAGKNAVIETTEGTIRARPLRFRNGAVSENWHMSGHGTGHGMTRIERQHLSDPVGVLVSYWSTPWLTWEWMLDRCYRPRRSATCERDAYVGKSRCC